MRDTFVKTLIEIAKEDKNIELLTGDLGFGVLKPFWEALPDQFTNVGIAEQNMTTMAAGMALEGKKVVTYSIGNFPTLRCLEQIRNDCAYHNANVKIVCVGGGFAYGPLGMSHHATEDLAIMRALPNVTVFAPGDLVEAELTTRAMIDKDGVCYLRLGRGGEKRIHDKINNFEIGNSLKLEEGKDIVLFSTGAILNEVIETKKILKSYGIDASIYSFPTVKPIDRNIIEKCAKEYSLIVSVEEHNIIGGFGGAVAEVLSELSCPKARLLRIGLNDIYTKIVGSQDYLRDFYDINATKIAKRIVSFIKG